MISRTKTAAERNPHNVLKVFSLSIWRHCKEGGGPRGQVPFPIHSSDCGFWGVNHPLLIIVCVGSSSCMKIHFLGWKRLDYTLGTRFATGVCRSEAKSACRGRFQGQSGVGPRGGEVNVYNVGGVQESERG